MGNRLKTGTVKSVWSQKKKRGEVFMKRDHLQTWQKRGRERSRRSAWCCWLHFTCAFALKITQTFLISHVFTWSKCLAFLSDSQFMKKSVLKMLSVSKSESNGNNCANKLPNTLVFYKSFGELWWTCKIKFLNKTI